LHLRVYCPIFWPILIKFGFIRQTFTEVPNIKFHGTMSSGNRAVTYRQKEGQTDRHDENNAPTGGKNVEANGKN